MRGSDPSQPLDREMERQPPALFRPTLRATHEQKQAQTSCAPAATRRWSICLCHNVLARTNATITMDTPSLPLPATTPRHAVPQDAALWSVDGPGMRGRSLQFAVPCPALRSDHHHHPLTRRERSPRPFLGGMLLFWPAPLARFGPASRRQRLCGRLASSRTSRRHWMP